MMMETLDGKIVQLYCKAYGWSLVQDTTQNDAPIVMVHPRYGQFDAARLAMTPRFIGFADGYLGKDFQAVENYRRQIEELDDVTLSSLYRQGFIRGENLRKERVC